VTDHNSHTYKTILGSSTISTNVKPVILCISVEDDYEVTAKQPFSYFITCQFYARTNVYFSEGMQ